MTPEDEKHVNSLVNVMSLLTVFKTLRDERDVTDDEIVKAAICNYIGQKLKVLAPNANPMHAVEETNKMGVETQKQITELLDGMVSDIIEGQTK